MMRNQWGRRTAMPICFVAGFVLGGLTCFLGYGVLVHKAPMDALYGKEVTITDAKTLLADARPFFEMFNGVLTNYFGEDAITASPQTKCDILVLLAESRIVCEVPRSLGLGAVQQTDVGVRCSCVIRLDEVRAALEDSVKMIELQLDRETDDVVRQRKEALLQEWYSGKNSGERGSLRKKKDDRPT